MEHSIVQADEVLLEVGVILVPLQVDAKPGELLEPHRLEAISSAAFGRLDHLVRDVVHECETLRVHPLIRSLVPARVSMAFDEVL